MDHGLEPLRGASGVFEAMLDASDEGTIRLPLKLGLAVVDEVRLMEAALDHCRVFLDRMEADHVGNVEYEAARVLITAARLRTTVEPTEQKRR